MSKFARFSVRPPCQPSLLQFHFCHTNTKHRFPCHFHIGYEHGRNHLPKRRMARVLFCKLAVYQIYPKPGIKRQRVPGSLAFHQKKSWSHSAQLSTQIIKETLSTSRFPLVLFLHKLRVSNDHQPPAAPPAQFPDAPGVLRAFFRTSEEKD